MSSTWEVQQFFLTPDTSSVLIDNQWEKRETHFTIIHRTWYWQSGSNWFSWAKGREKARNCDYTNVLNTFVEFVNTSHLSDKWTDIFQINKQFSSFETTVIHFPWLSKLTSHDNYYNPILLTLKAVVINSCNIGLKYYLYLERGQL